MLLKKKIYGIKTHCTTPREDFLCTNNTSSKTHQIEFHPSSFLSTQRLEPSIKPPFNRDALETSHKHPKPLLLPLRRLWEDLKRVSSNHKMNWSNASMIEKSFVRIMVNIFSIKQQWRKPTLPLEDSYRAISSL